MQLQRSLLCFTVLAALLLSGCVRRAGEKFSMGIMDGLAQSKLDSTVHLLSQRAVQGALAVALHDSVQARLRGQLDSVSRQLDRQVQASTLRLRDSLMGEYTKVWLQGRIDAAGATAAYTVTGILDDMRSQKTRLFLAGLRDELLGDSTLLRAAAFRNELLGKQTHLLVDSLVQKVASSLMANQVHPGMEKLKADLNAQVQNARRLAYLIGGVALLLAGVAGYIFLKARKHKATLKILTKQIDHIPDQVVYDQLVASIRRETSSQGLEPHLQSILKEENLYQQEVWKNKDHQLLQLITEHLIAGEGGRAAGPDLLRDIVHEAEKRKLDGHLQSVLARSAPKNNSLPLEPVEA